LLLGLLFLSYFRSYWFFVGFFLFI